MPPVNDEDKPRLDAMACNSLGGPDHNQMLSVSQFKWDNSWLQVKNIPQPGPLVPDKPQLYSSLRANPRDHNLL